MREAGGAGTEDVVGCRPEGARPTGTVMVASQSISRNLGRAQSEGPRQGVDRPSAAKGSIKAGAPKNPGLVTYSYQPSPESSQYSALDNTH